MGLAINHERDRKLERQTAPGDQNQRPFSHRRERPEALVPGVEPGRKGAENAAPEWCMAKAQFAILFEERFSLA